MSETVERVAKIIAASVWDGLLPWDKMPEGYQEGYRKYARRAIAEMREPTEAMVRVADQLPVDDMAAVWRAMIDVALK